MCIRDRANHEEETAVPELLQIAQDAALEALQAEAKATTDPETYARVKEMCSAITRRDEISEALPEEYKQYMEKLKDKRNDFVRLRDAALVAAQNEVIAAQDRYDSHDVTRVVRKLDILAQAESKMCIRDSSKAADEDKPPPTGTRELISRSAPNSSGSIISLPPS